MIKNNLCGMTLEEVMLHSGNGVKETHGFAITNSIYKKGISKISDLPKIPKEIKELIEINNTIHILSPHKHEVSNDKSVKYLFRTEDERCFETVFLPENKRNTVCVSVQSGCRMGCPYCLTSQYGFRGDLSSGEILSQIIGIPYRQLITRVVFMGMGEPMDNLDNVLKACKIMTSEWGFSLGSSNITVSTVGITPGIIRFLNESDCNLTVSLHSPFSAERSTIIPIEKKYPVNEIIRILKTYPIKKKRRFTFAYIMINGFNDTDSHLEELKRILRGTQIRVNLIPFHNTGKGDLKSSSAERMQYYRHSLVVNGVSASIRKSRGTDISAACGQLAAGFRS
jgi:23S rRNA (adenine2503-C2)-methyltransferase